jgi:hypothetical protein
MVAVYCLFWSIVIGGGLDHCMTLPPSVVDVAGVVVPAGVWLQADSIIPAVISTSMDNF